MPPASPRSRSSARVSPAASAPVPPTSPAVPPHPDLTLPPARRRSRAEATEAIEPEEPARFSRRPRPSKPSPPDVPSVDVPTAPSATPIQREVADAKAPVTPADVATDPVATTPPSPARPPWRAGREQPGAGRRCRRSRCRWAAVCDVDPAVDHAPGPGTPAPTLVVRPAPLIPDPPSRERVVPIQRMPAAEPPSPPRPRTGSSAHGCAGRGSGRRDEPGRSGRAGPPAPHRRRAPPPAVTIRRAPARASASAGMPLGTGSPDRGFPQPDRPAVASDRLRPTGPSTAVHAPALRAPARDTRGTPASPRSADLRRTPAGPVGHRRGAEPGRGHATPNPPRNLAWSTSPDSSTPWPDASSALDTGQVVVARAEDPAAVADAAPAAAVGGASGGGPAGSRSRQ